MLKKLSKHELSILKYELLNNLMLYPDAVRVYFDERFNMYKIQFLKKTGLKAKQMDIGLLIKEDNIDTKSIQRQLEEFFIRPNPNGIDFVEVKVGLEK